MEANFKTENSIKILFTESLGYPASGPHILPSASGPDKILTSLNWI